MSGNLDTSLRFLLRLFAGARQKDVPGRRGEGQLETGKVRPSMSMRSKLSTGTGRENR